MPAPVCVNVFCVDALDVWMKPDWLWQPAIRIHHRIQIEPRSGLARLTLSMWRGLKTPSRTALTRFCAGASGIPSACALLLQPAIAQSIVVAKSGGREGFLFDASFPYFPMQPAHATANSVCHGRTTTASG